MRKALVALALFGAVSTTLPAFAGGLDQGNHRDRGLHRGFVNGMPPGQFRRGESDRDRDLFQDRDRDLSRTRVFDFTRGHRRFSGGRLERRQSKQESRILKGERLGQLTPRESFILRRHEANLARLSARLERGGLTRQERRLLQNQYNQESQLIFALRHNQGRMR